jgi:hypothetical protein
LRGFGIRDACRRDVAIGETNLIRLRQTPEPRLSVQVVTTDVLSGLVLVCDAMLPLNS